ncbi:MAG TPA: hypothetical protein VFL14_14415 [Xanthomonadales bacterium]|nr:hypothetical protein [Xanthomonadales bacterium]
MQNIDAMRDEIAAITQRGIGMPMAGMAYWIAMAALGSVLAPKAAALAMFFGTGAVFPLGWWLTKRAGGDLMHKGHPLTGLGMTLNFVQLAYWPVVLAVFGRDPMLVPLTLGTLFGSHFLPYGWFYRSRGYGALGIAAPVVATLLQLAAPARAFVLIPLGVAACYALAIALVHRENAVQEKLAAA